MTGTANLFTMFVEPDVQIERPDGQVVVRLRGVDVYNPTTGVIRSNDTTEIALWMIDSDYDEESFFVRHCYFSGGGHRPLRPAQAGTEGRDRRGRVGQCVRHRLPPVPASEERGRSRSRSSTTTATRC